MPIMPVLCKNWLTEKVKTDNDLAARAQKLVLESLEEDNGKQVVIAALQLATNPIIAIPCIMRNLTFKIAQLLLADGKSQSFSLTIMSNRGYCQKKKKNANPFPRRPSFCRPVYSPHSSIRPVQPCTREHARRKILLHDPPRPPSIPRTGYPNHCRQITRPPHHSPSGNRTALGLESYKAKFGTDGFFRKR